MTTYTSNKNEFSGKNFTSKSANMQDKYEYRENNKGGCFLVIVLVIVAVVLITVVLPHILH